MKINASKYKNIVNKGCGGYSIDTPSGIEFDCAHNYRWCCEDCPCCIEFQKNKKANEKSQTKQAETILLASIKKEW